MPLTFRYALFGLMDCLNNAKFENIIKNNEGLKRRCQPIRFTRISRSVVCSIIDFRGDKTACVKYKEAEAKIVFSTSTCMVIAGKWIKKCQMQNKSLVLKFTRRYVQAGILVAWYGDGSRQWMRCR